MGAGTVTVRDRKKRAESCKRRVSNDVVRVCFNRTPRAPAACGVVLAIKTCSRPLQGAAFARRRLETSNNHCHCPYDTALPVADNLRQRGLAFVPKEVFPSVERI